MPDPGFAPPLPPEDGFGSPAPAQREFRITSEVEIRALLKQLCDRAAPIMMSGSDGSSYQSRIWSIDSQKNVVAFAADPHDSRLQALTESNEITAVGFLESVKVQFDVYSLMLVHNGKQSALHSNYPREVYRFQRRNSFRVKPLLSSSPVARFRHPDDPELQLDLRLLDVSVGGCALFMPQGIPPLQPGVVIDPVRIELDADTRVLVKLRLQHVTSFNPDSQGVRLGMEMIHMSADVERTLIRFVDQTQRRRRYLAKE